ncbi:sensor domain-containing diguanylate cyclase [Lysobacter olei]
MGGNRKGVRGIGVRGWYACVLVLLLGTLAGLAPARAEPQLRMLVSESDVAATHVLGEDRTLRWSPALPRQAMFPAGTGVRWLRIDPGPHAGSQRRVTLARLPMRSIQVWVPHGAQGWQRYEDGFFNPAPAPRTLHAFAWPLDPVAGARPIYVRLEHRGRLYLNVGVTSTDEMLATEARFVAALTTCLTVLAVMLLVNLMFWVNLRERMYLAYVGAVSALSAWLLFATGLAYLWIGGAAEWRWPGSPSGMLLALGNAALVGFMHGFFGLATGDRRAAQATRLLAGALIVVALCFMLPGSGGARWPGVLASWTFSVVPPVMLWVLVRQWQRGTPGAGLFALAWLPYGTLSMVRTAVTWGWIEPLPWTLFGAAPAIAFQSLVLGLALVRRALELRQERDLALRLASHDALTATLNRRAGEARLDQMWQAWRQRGVPLCVLFVDMDRFKQVNDRYGHEIGDRCLLAVTEAVRELLPPRAVFVRWGGDEFVVLLPGLRQDDALRLANDIVSAVDASRVPVEDGHVALEASVGIAHAQPSIDSAAALVRRADQALYRAKREGGARVVLA